MSNKSEVYPLDIKFKSFMGESSILDRNINDFIQGDDDYEIRIVKLKSFAEGMYTTVHIWYIERPRIDEHIFS